MIVITFTLLLIVGLVSYYIFFMRKPKVEQKPEVESEPISQDMPQEEEVQVESETAEQLEDLKDKLDTLGTTETYTIKGNPGLSIGGTILEQTLDIAIAFFKQPLINEAMQRIIKDESDATTITDMITEIGQEIVSTLKTNQILTCAKPFNCSKKEGEPVENNAGVVSQPYKYVCDDKELGSYDGMRKHVNDAVLYKTDKVSDCDRYLPNMDSLNTIRQRVTDKLKTMLTDTEKQRLFYDTIVSIGKNNMDFFATQDPRLNIIMEERGNPFNEDGDFVKQVPYSTYESKLNEFANKF